MDFMCPYKSIYFKYINNKEVEMLDNLQKDFDSSVEKIAESSLIKKLNKQGISRNDISSSEFNELLKLEIEILKADGRKVGAGIAVGIGISLLTGGLF